MQCLVPRKLEIGYIQNSINILQKEHVIEVEDLAKQLETRIHPEGDEKGYFGLTEHQA